MIYEAAIIHCPNSGMWGFILTDDHGEHVHSSDAEFATHAHAEDAAEAYAIDDGLGEVFSFLQMW